MRVVFFVTPGSTTPTTILGLNHPGMSLSRRRANLAADTSRLNSTRAARGCAYVTMNRTCQNMTSRATYRFTCLSSSRQPQPTRSVGTGRSRNCIGSSPAVEKQSTFSLASPQIPFLHRRRTHFFLLDSCTFLHTCIRTFVRLRGWNVKGGSNSDPGISGTETPHFPLLLLLRPPGTRRALTQHIFSKLPASDLQLFPFTPTHPRPAKV